MADAQTGTEADDQTGTDAPVTDSGDSRSVLLGAFWRALAETDSLLLKSYAVVSALLTGLVALLLLLALPVWVFNSAGGSELATFSRTFLVVGGVFLLLGLIAPVIGAGHRHARGTANRRVDYLFAVSGYLFVLALYLSLLISAPPDQRGTPPALLAPVVEFLYVLPSIYAIAPPILAGALIGVVYRFAR